MKRRILVLMAFLTLVGAAGLGVHLRRSRAKPRTWANSFVLGVDLTRLQQGDWVEYDDYWNDGGDPSDGYRHTWSATTRMACVRANPDDVWMEVSLYGSGDVLLFHVERKTRRILAGWEMLRGNAPVAITISDPANWKPPAANRPLDVSDASGNVKVVALQILDSKVAAQEVTFEFSMGPPGDARVCRGTVVLSEDVPFPIPLGGDSNQAFPCDIVGQVGTKISWKNPPDLRGGIVSADVRYEDPAIKGVHLQTKILRGFGRDAVPTVIVAGETDKASLK